jgi:ATP-dependent Lon protease
MNVLSSLRLVAANTSRCRRTLFFAWDAGTRRTYSTSRIVRANPSLSLYSPRWTNNAHGIKLNEGSKQGDGGEAPADGSGSSAPPSSSDGGDNADSNAPPPSDSPPSSPPKSSQASIAKRSVPEVYPQVLALPIARRPLFPGFYKAVVIRNPSVVAAIKEMMKRGQPYLGAFLLKDENTDSDVITDIDSVHSVGVFAQITSVFAATGSDDKEEGLTAVLYPHRRIKITELIKNGSATVEEVPSSEEASQPEVVAESENTPSEDTAPAAETPSSVVPLQTSFLHKHAISLVSVDNLPPLPYDKEDPHIRAFMSEIVSVFKDIAQLNPLFRDQITNFSINQVANNVFDEPDKLADFAAAVSTGDVQELQDVLEAQQIDERLRRALLVLKKELINAQLQSKLSRDVDSKIAKRQREYYLMEQLKGIKKELGMESDGKDKLIEKFKERAAALKMPEGVRKVFDEELNKLASLEPAASEANVTRNYLDWLTQVCFIVFLHSYRTHMHIDSLGSTYSRELLHRTRPDRSRRRSLWSQGCQGSYSGVPRGWQASWHGTG